MYLLYSAGDEHAATETATPDIESNGALIMPFEVWCKRSENVKVAGVYAVLDAERRTQYIGYSSDHSTAPR